jgi:hypothetical protein
MKTSKTLSQKRPGQSVGQPSTATQSRQTISEYWIRQSNGKARKYNIREGGSRPILGGLIVMPGRFEWPETELREAIAIVDQMVPKALLVIAPKLAIPGRPETASSPRHRLDFVPIRTSFPGRWQTMDVACLPELGVIYLSLSSTTSPTSMVVHEAWHFAETRLFTDEEIDGVAMSYVYALTANEGRSLGPTELPQEWAACVFTMWMNLWNATKLVGMIDTLDRTFHTLASGEMAKRRLRPAKDIEAVYRRLANRYLGRLQAESPESAAARLAQLLEWR